jgi:hypothetical protein
MQYPGLNKVNAGACDWFPPLPPLLSSFYNISSTQLASGFDYVRIWQTDLSYRLLIGGQRSPVTGQGSKGRPTSIERSSSAGHRSPVSGQRSPVTGQGLHMRSTSQSRSFSSGHRSPVNNSRSPVTCLRDYDHSR